MPVLHTRITKVVGQKNGGGSECSFYRINNKKGLKVYFSKKEAKFAHRKQKRLSNCNLAPKIFSDIVPVLKQNVMLWGFYTEVAERASKHRRIFHQQKDALYAQLLKHRMVGDFCMRNLGVLQGKLVLIDCGFLSGTTNAL